LHQIKKALYGSEITDGRNTYRMGENTWNYTSSEELKFVIYKELNSITQSQLTCLKYG
jgi:hypothetical protein